MRKHLITTLILIGSFCLMGCEQTESGNPVTNEEPTSVDSIPIAQAQTDDALAAGRVIYDLHCAGCHAPGLGHAGTMQLKLVRAEGLSVLVQRTDLTPAYIYHIVRDGLLEMPPFRPTDINDEELENLAQYIIAQGNAYNQPDATHE